MRRLKILSLLFTASIAFAEVANMSGRWVLNLDKSQWGKKPRPQGIEITVDHKDPALKYSGIINPGTEASTSKFEFNGAVDGKEYTAGDGSAQQAKVKVWRVDDRTVASELRTPDGSVLQQTTTTVVQDGKTLIRKIKHKGPEGTHEWAEFYDKR